VTCARAEAMLAKKKSIAFCAKNWDKKVNPRHIQQKLIKQGGWNDNSQD
jgi:hypothetical protein